MVRLILLLAVPLMLLGNTIAWVRFAWSLVFSPKRAWRIAVGYDQLVNVAANGDEDETISSRAGKGTRKVRWWGCVLCQVQVKIEDRHCDQNGGPWWPESQPDRWPAGRAFWAPVAPHTDRDGWERHWNCSCDQRPRSRHGPSYCRG